MRELLAKYHEMRAMRDADAGDPRARMRGLAARFPGALREIDELTDAILDARISTLEAVVHRGAAPPAWARRIADYHGWMRAALATRRAAGRARDLARAIAWIERDYAPSRYEPPASELRAVVQHIMRPPDGRLNRWLFVHLAARHGIGAAAFEAELFPPSPQRRGCVDA